jgi:hypothetical protein
MNIAVFCMSVLVNFMGIYWTRNVVYWNWYID